MPVIRQSTRSHQVVIRQSSRIHHAVIRQSAVSHHKQIWLYSHQKIMRQSSDGHQVSCQASCQDRCQNSCQDIYQTVIGSSLDIHSTFIRRTSDIHQTFTRRLSDSHLAIIILLLFILIAKNAFYSFILSFKENKVLVGKISCQIVIVCDAVCLSKFSTWSWFCHARPR